MKKNRGLYIHIPFCTHLCSYCDFSKLLYDKDLVKRYLDELNLELQERKIKDITSIYIGGGTPTSLDEEELEYLLKMIDLLLPNMFSFSSNVYFPIFPPLIMTSVYFFYYIL